MLARLSGPMVEDIGDFESGCFNWGSNFLNQHTYEQHPEHPAVGWFKPTSTVSRWGGIDE